jgi:acyl carrier protein
MVAPRNELERSIAAVWEKVLGVAEVPIHTNFFDMGGHSLLLAQVRIELAGALGADVSIIDLFQYPTVSGLAAHLSESSGSPSRAADQRPKKRSLAAGRQMMRKRRRARE